MPAGRDPGADGNEVDMSPASVRLTKSARYCGRTLLPKLKRSHCPAHGPDTRIRAVAAKQKSRIRIPSRGNGILLVQGGCGGRKDSARDGRGDRGTRVPEQAEWQRTTRIWLNGNAFRPNSPLAPLSSGGHDRGITERLRPPCHRNRHCPIRFRHRTWQCPPGCPWPGGCRREEASSRPIHPAQGCRPPA